jgi:Amt family ammonium transporter
VDPVVGAPVIGVLAGLVPYFACTKLKAVLGYDDALDTFGVHAVGGTLGAILTGVLATASVNANLTTANTLANPELARLVQQGGLIVAQLKAVGLTLVLALVGTVVLAYATKLLVGGLRPTPDIEREGLDIAEHGEEGYTTA